MIKGESIKRSECLWMQKNWFR